MLPHVVAGGGMEGSRMSRGDLRKTRVEWKIAVAGIAVSAGLSIFFYVRTDLKAALATFAGLLGITIVLQIETLLREQRVSHEATRQLRLISQIESIPWLPALLDEGLHSLRSFERTYGGTLVGQLGQRAFEQALQSFRDLEHGNLETPYGDNSLRNQLTESVSKTMLATSVENVDLNWWHSPPGDRYWHLHHEAMRRGVAIRRVFIYQTWTEAHESLARQQHEAGVTVFRVDRTQLPVDLRRNIVLWDGTFAYETRANADGESIGIRYIFSPQEVQQMIGTYHLIESRAEPWPPESD